MLKLFRRGAYTGRLAFDPTSGFHTDPAGRKIVTLDAGKTWRYARRSDTPHNFRYGRAVAVIDSTANAESPQAHHWNVHPDDPHAAGLQFVPDALAATVTSHTGAWL